MTEKIAVSTVLNDSSPPFIFDSLGEALEKCRDLSSGNPNDEPIIFYVWWLDDEEAESESERNI